MRSASLRSSQLKTARGSARSLMANTSSSPWTPGRPTSVSSRSTHPRPRTDSPSPSITVLRSSVPSARSVTAENVMNWPSARVRARRTDGGSAWKGRSALVNVSYSSTRTWSFSAKGDARDQREGAWRREKIEGVSCRPVQERAARKIQLGPTDAPWANANHSSKNGGGLMPYLRRSSAEVRSAQAMVLGQGRATSQLDGDALRRPNGASELKRGLTGGDTQPRPA